MNYTLIYASDFIMCFREAGDKIKEASRDQIKVNLSWELLKGTDIVRVSTLTAHSISLVGNGSQED